MKQPAIKKTTLFAALLASGLLTAGNAQAAAGLDAVKAYMVEHGTRMLENSKKLSHAAEEYYEEAEEHHFKYPYLWKKYRQEIAGWTDAMKKAWMAAHNNYEEVEGIVAGIPSLARYDLIIDAGNPGTEKEDVAPYDLKLPDGKVLKRPGNLFHTLLEPALWGTKKEYVGMEADLNGNGRVELGEVLPKADLLYAFARTHTEWTQKMLDDVKAWQPNKDDLFTAMVTMGRRWAWPAGRARRAIGPGNPLIGLAKRAVSGVLVFAPQLADQVEFQAGSLGDLFVG